MESVQPPAGSQVSRVPAQRTPPDQVAPGPLGHPPTPRRRPWRLILAAVGGLLLLVCTAGAVTAYVAYDRFTAPDRSTPIVVVDSYLQAFLVERDDVKAKLFRCEDKSDVGEISGLRSEVERREREFDVYVRVTWGALERMKRGQGESVQTTLVIAGYATADSQSRSSRQERWEFDVLDQDGWRVCGSRKID